MDDSRAHVNTFKYFSLMYIKRGFYESFEGRVAEFFRQFNNLSTYGIENKCIICRCLSCLYSK